MAATAHARSVQADWQQWSPMDLPVNTTIKARALKQIASPSANAYNIARYLQHEPVLCLQLFHLANQHLAASGNELHEPAHAISLLGFPSVEALINNSRTIDETSKHVTEYRQQLNISILAAFEARGWAEHNNHWPEQELYWASLFQQAPLWALWHHEADKMMELQRFRAKRNGTSSQQSEQELFGMPLSTLCSQLAKQWCLPSLTQASWLYSAEHKAKLWLSLGRCKSSEHIPQAVQSLCSSPGFAVALANHFAVEAQWNWLSRRCIRLQKMLARALHISTDQAIILTHQCAIDASSAQYQHQCVSSAAQLLSFYRQAPLYLSAVNSAEQLSGLTDQAKSTGAVSDDTDVANIPKHMGTAAAEDFPHILSRLVNDPQSFGSIRDVMNFAISRLCNITGLERATISLLNHHTGGLRCLYHFGCKHSPALKAFSHGIERGDLFDKLMRKSASLRLNAKTYHRLWPLLPTDFQRACRCDEFFMMSLFAGDRPIALLYADRGVSHKALSDTQYTQFKQLGQAICRCLAKRDDLNQSPT